MRQSVDAEKYHVLWKDNAESTEEYYSPKHPPPQSTQLQENLPTCGTKVSYPVGYGWEEHGETIINCGDTRKHEINSVQKNASGGSGIDKDIKWNQKIRPAETNNALLVVIND
jgi:hypothetical protein